MPPPLIHHHLGVACRDLDRAACDYRALDYLPESPDFVDPLQGVRGRFLVGPGPRIELLQELEGSVVLEPWLARGGSSIYHHAFEVASLDEGIRHFEALGASVVRSATPASAFSGRPIVFLMLRNLTLIELVEADRPEERR